MFNLIFTHRKQFGQGRKLEVLSFSFSENLCEINNYLCPCVLALKHQDCVDDHLCFSECQRLLFSPSQSFLLPHTLPFPCHEHHVNNHKF